MFNHLRNSVKCCLTHSYATTPDTLGKIFVYLQCHNCEDINFCLKIKRVLEEELNKEEAIK